MLLLGKATPINRSDLGRLPTPPATRTWRPVPHDEVVGALITQAQARGLQITREQYGIMDGAYNPQAGLRVAVKAARLFAAFDFRPLPGSQFPTDCVPSLALVNSCDKSKALKVLAGAKVVVCSNGLATAEFVVSRKHSAAIDPTAEIRRALDLCTTNWDRFRGLHERLRAVRLSRSKARALVVELARKGAFASDQILGVVAEFEAPRHSQFRDRTMWSLVNAATEAAFKRQSPPRQVQGFRVLHRVLLAPLMN